MACELSPGEVERRVEVARTALAEAWAYPEGLAVAARAIGALAAGYRGMIHFREPDGGFSEIGVDLHGQLRTSWADFPAPNTLARLQQCLGYRFDRPDALTGKVVLTSDIYRDEERRMTYLQLLRDNGFDDSIRVMLRRRGRMRVWCGAFLSSGERTAGAVFMRRLARVIPALEDATRAADLTRYGRADAGAVQLLFGAIDQPVWLVTSRGTVAYANEAARRLGADEATRARRAAAGSRDPFASISRVSIDRDPVTLVIGRQPTQEVLSALPISLRRVARAVANGWTDKEIAKQLVMPLATVRTYVRRCYARLGVHSRAELVALCSSGAGPRRC